MKIIKTNRDQYILVDESIQPVTGQYYDTFINKIRNTNGAEYAASSNCLQIIQQLSLQEVKELIGEVDVEKKAREEGGYDVFRDRIIYSHGYNQALEDNKEKKYTEEDLHYLLNLLTYDDLTEDEKIQSCIEYIKNLLQPKTEWEVEWETIDNREPCDCSCHNNPNMIHFVACCNDGWIGKVTKKLKLK